MTESEGRNRKERKIEKKNKRQQPDESGKDIMAGRRILDFATTKVLGIDPDERYDTQPGADVLDHRARALLDPADVFLEREPTATEFLRELAPTRAAAADYVQSLFPSASWARRYGARWLAGDLVAGLTIGLVVVPQAMAYALLAQLSPAYGLYTSFTGAVLYWLFGTSKDIVIGVRPFVPPSPFFCPSC